MKGRMGGKERVGERGREGEGVGKARRANQPTQRSPSPLTLLGLPKENIWSSDGGSPRRGVRLRPRPCLPPSFCPPPVRLREIMSQCGERRDERKEGKRRGRDSGVKRGGSRGKGGGMELIN